MSHVVFDQEKGAAKTAREAAFPSETVSAKFDMQTVHKSPIVILELVYVTPGNT